MSPLEAAAVIRVRIVRGSIHLPRELCEACFPQSNAVALLARDDRLLIVPLAPDSAGGLLLKQRNARGDRVVHAQEFLRQQGLADESEPQTLAVRWEPAMAALSIAGLMTSFAKTTCR